MVRTLDNDNGHSTRFQSFQFRGHQGSVLCLDSNASSSSSSSSSSAGNNGSLLLSGSEDQTCRLWDIRAHGGSGSKNTNRNDRAAMCLMCDDAVLAVQFGCSTTTAATATTNYHFTAEGDHPCKWWKASFDSDICARDHLVYLAAGRELLWYDLRYATSPVVKVLLDTSRSCSSSSSDHLLLKAQDEINQVVVVAHDGESMSTTTNAASVAAAAAACCDDAGRLHFLFGPTLSQRRSVCHGDNALVTALVHCRNNCGGDSWISGGTDCTLQLWNSSGQQQEPRSTLHIPMSEQGAQVTNPPMVNCLAAVEATGDSDCVIVAGLGDGSLALLTIQNADHDDNASLVLQQRIDQAHSGAVACCDVSDSGRRLFTAGNDGRVAMWENFSAPLDEKELPQVVGSIAHHRKPNWILVADNETGMGSYSNNNSVALFVADTSNDITLYRLE